MESQNFQEETNTELTKDHLAPLKCVTPLSKYLAMALFIILPFLGGWIGYMSAPEKVVEIEKIVEAERVIEQVSDIKPEKRWTPNQFVLELAPELREENYGPLGVTDPVSIYLTDGIERKLLKTLPGDCQSIENAGPRVIEENMQPDEIFIDAFGCWYAGAGYEMFMFASDDNIRVVGREKQECGNVVGCYPYSDGVVLFEN